MSTALNAQASYTDTLAVTPADGTPLSKGVCRGLFFNATAAQTLRVTMAGGTVANFTLAVAGSYVFPIAASTVETTGTNVSGIVALY